MQKLLVPVDGSEGADKAARFAAQQARLGDAEITLLHVTDPSAPGAARFFENVPGATDEHARVAQAALERAKAVMAGVDVKAHLVEAGAPAERILSVAEQLGITHIIMGSRGLSPLKELMLGSVSHRVVRDAHCPVTIAH